ncbi:hypothetical protein GCM10010492_37900 [Saccharothrix mutabilis subsp. mutabilis]|uniref:Uncharacterized protein n=1 Tax=Saccharothrix mutabilis subsp. mutabilis TaxID=66855 RepID=A0ABN0U1F4_9PSEU
MFDRHAEAVWNHAHRLTASWSLAEDLTSATLVESKDRMFAGVVALPSLEPQVLKGVRLTAYAADRTVLRSEPLH